MPRTLYPAARPLCAALLSMLFTARATSAAAPPPATQPRFTYETWTRAFADQLTDHKLLIITRVEESKDPQPFSSIGNSADAISRYSLTDDGRTWWEYHDAEGHKGGDGSRPVPPESFPRLNALLAALPDDAARLPPPERRIMLQFHVNGRPVTRVYDRALLSDSQLELFRLSNTFVSSWVPTFAPVQTVLAGDDEIFGLLTLTPDGTHLVSILNNRPPRLWDATTHASLGEIALRPGNPEIAFSPDGKCVARASSGTCDLFSLSADLKTWKPLKTLQAARNGDQQSSLYAPQFTPDGKLLLLRQGDDALRAFDTTTWQPAPLPPAIPPDAAAYAPAPDAQRAVVQLPHNQLSLWDPQQHKLVAPLYTGSRHWLASFSPDHTLLALAYLPKENAGVGRGIHIQLFNAATGAPLHALFAGDSTDAEHVNALAWAPDSRTLLAATEATVSAFNTSTGRQSGQFTNRPQILALTLLPGNHQFATLSEDGYLRYFDLDSALQTIKTFTTSLPAPTTTPH